VGEITNCDESKHHECPGRSKLKKTGFKVNSYDLARKEDVDGKEMLEEEDEIRNDSFVWSLKKKRTTHARKMHWQRRNFLAQTWSKNVFQISGFDSV
jgi:predicted metal-binding transcription factor (methanogenesis marker protein 9)